MQQRRSIALVAGLIVGSGGGVVRCASQNSGGQAGIGTSSPPSISSPLGILGLS